MRRLPSSRAATPSLVGLLDLWTRRAAPLASAFLIVALGALPWPLPGLAAVAPMLPLIAVFFWVQRRPEAFSPLAAFLVGAAEDVLVGTPLGLHALGLLFAHGATALIARHLRGQPFVLVWLAFALVAAGAIMLTWLLASLIYLTLVGFHPLVVQFAMTVLALPPTMWLLSQFELLVLDDEEK